MRGGAKDAHRYEPGEWTHVDGDHGRSKSAVSGVDHSHGRPRWPIHQGL